MITRLSATDRNNKVEEFEVTQESFTEGNYPGIRYKIGKPNISQFRYFEFCTLELPNDSILIYMLINHNHQDLMEKGIVKAMIKSLSMDLRKNIVSSTNKQHLKISESEGRIHDMTKAWIKWKSEMNNIEYLKEEDRFIYRTLAPVTTILEN